MEIPSFMRNSSSLLIEFLFSSERGNDCKTDYMKVTVFGSNLGFSCISLCVGFSLVFTSKIGFCSRQKFDITRLCCALV